MRVGLYVILVFVLSLLVGGSLAQDGSERVYTVAFDGVELQYSSTVAENVAITHYAGDPVDGAGPGFSDAAHFTFNLYSEPYPELVGEAFPARIRVYRMDDLMQYDFMADKLGEVQWMLTTRPDLVEYYEPDKPLPYLPILPHGQVLRAQASYVESDSLQGIAYVTSVQFAAIEPLLSDSMIYAFQGISSDGQYYVSADFALDVSVFPETTPENFEIEAFVNNFSAYLLESVTALNSDDGSVFAPQLETLNAVIQSMTFE